VKKKISEFFKKAETFLQSSVTTVVQKVNEKKLKNFLKVFETFSSSPLTTVVSGN